jgi:hypothetical protein
MMGGKLVALPARIPMNASKRIDEKIASLGDWRGERLAEIRELIHRVDPEVVEEWKWMGTPVWSHEGMYALANAHKDKVKLTFFHGAQLPDPKQLFNAGMGGGKWRAIDFYRGDKIDKTALAALLRAAVAYNSLHSVPKSKGSREQMPSKAKHKPKGRPKSKSGSKSRSKAKPTATRRGSLQGKRSPAPKLLSGGNPQIAKAEGDAPVQAYIAAMPGWKRDVGRRLDELIERTVPHVRKAVKWNSPFYGIEGQGWFLSLHCFTSYIKVAFFRGTSLSPLPPGKSKHEEVRYLDVHEDDLDEAQMAAWVKQAAAIPGWDGKA